MNLLTVLPKIFRLARFVILLGRAEDHAAQSEWEESWRLVRKAEALAKVKFGERSWRPEVNLQISMVALAVGDHELALKCALAAEQALLRRGGLPVNDAKYLSYYAVMISRLARQKMGERTVHPTLVYPKLSDGEMDQVHHRWRRKFPLTEVDPADVP